MLGREQNWWVESDRNGDLNAGNSTFATGRSRRRTRSKVEMPGSRMSSDGKFCSR